MPPTNATRTAASATDHMDTASMAGSVSTLRTRGTITTPTRAPATEDASMKPYQPGGVAVAVQREGQQEGQEPHQAPQDRHGRQGQDDLGVGVGARAQCPHGGLLVPRVRGSRRRPGRLLGGARPVVARRVVDRPTGNRRATTVPTTNTTMSRRRTQAPPRSSSTPMAGIDAARLASDDNRPRRALAVASSSPPGRSEAATTRGTSEPLVTRYTLDSTSMMKASGNSKGLPRSSGQHQAHRRPGRRARHHHRGPSGPAAAVDDRAEQRRHHREGRHGEQQVEDHLAPGLAGARP